MVRIVSSLAISPAAPPPLKPTPLVLHVDINETVLVGDEAGNDTRQESLNKILAKSAFVCLPETGEDTHCVTPTHWWDGTEIGQENENEPPPLYTGWQWPPGCAPYYRTAMKKRSKTFVEGDGHVYKQLHDKMQEVLSFDDASLPPVVSHMLPSIFHTLAVLSNRNEPFRLVLRSFGSDIEQVAEAISLFARGRHPDYPDFRNDALIAAEEDLVTGRWHMLENGETTFQLWKDECIVASGDDEVLDWIEQRTICGIQDDHDFWSKHDCEPWAGKPVWVPSRSSHHVLLDDNIHNLEHDSIASVRLQSSQGEPFKTLSGREIQQMQGVHLIRVPTIEPILNQDWFLQQIDEARARYAAVAAETRKEEE